MLNNALTEKFLSKPPVPITQVKEVPYDKIISLLRSVTKGDFSWNIAGEEFVTIEGEMCVMTTVTLYVPGYVSTGRSLIKIKRYADNHLFALLDAAKNLDVFIARQDPDKINTNAEFVNAKDDNGMPTESVSFDKITKEAEHDILGMNAPEQGQPQTQAQVQKSAKFTPEQIKRLRNIQVEHEIHNPEEFGRYVHSWSNGKLTSKSDITPENADSFLEYMDSLGEIVS